MDPSQLTVAVVLAWQLGAPERRALLDACTRAFPVGTCVEGEVSTGAAVVAHVGSDAEQRVLLRVREESGGPGGEIERSLGFLPEDTPLEQAKAVGLTLGVLAGELQRRARETPEVTTPAPGSDRVPEPDPAPDSASGSTARAATDGTFGQPRGQAEASFEGFATLQVGAGRDPGLAANEAGATLRGGWRPSRRPWRLGAVVDFWRASAPTDGVRLDKAHFALSGAWVGYLTPHVELGLGADVGIQTLWARTAAPLAADRAGRIVPMLRTTATAVYWAGEVWGVGLTTQGTWVASRTRLFLRQQEVGNTGRFGFAVLLGPALRWDVYLPAAR